MSGIQAPRYMPAKVLRALTKEQLAILQSQLNTKGITSQNGLRAMHILYQAIGRTNPETGILAPLTMTERGWSIPTEKTIDLSEWLNGTELIEGREQWI